ncbi:methyltransferase domain-containing protein [Candidatus Parcubacteria bacterium]|nr:methyltransferase domain-containing protein [Candidatus Parcubacteria bacterium]
MKYFFILGSNPVLSLAELSAVFNLAKNSKEIKLLGNILLLELGNDINPSKLIKKIGGTIKIGRIEKIANRYTDQTDKIIKLLNPGEGKFKYGFSYYGPGKFDAKTLAMKIKNHLRENKVSCRWVTSKERTLSSVVVEQNKLTGPGLEIVLIADNKNLYIGRTLAVQAFKELSYRDYGRPERDDKSGMLPPKLAQIMINLSGIKPDPDTIILDPFCGSGTVLAEALIMGHKNIIGSDSSEKAISDTRKNIVWIEKKFEIRNSKFEIIKSSATELTKKIKPSSIDAIVTEPYLGPQRGRINIKQTVAELNKLYSNALKEFKKVLAPNGRVVMVWPIFRVTHNLERITPNLTDFKIINPISKNLQENKTVNLTSRNTIIYGREGQRIWREIVLLAPDS